MREMSKLHVHGHISVSAETYAKLEKRAKKERKSVSLLVDEWINNELNRNEK